MTTVPGNRDQDPLQGNRCSITFDEEVKGLLISCDGLESVNEICESRSMGLGGLERPMSRTPGKLTIDPLELELFVLKGDTYFEKWLALVQKGEIKEATRDGTISMFDSLNVKEAEWTIFSAWPSKIAYTDLDTESNDALKLTVTLIYEGFKRVKV